MATKTALLKTWEIVEDKLKSGKRRELAKTYAKAYGDEWLASVSDVGFDLQAIRNLHNKLWVDVDEHHGHSNDHGHDHHDHSEH